MEFETTTAAAQLRTPHPRVAFARATALLVPAATPPSGIHPTAVVPESATLGEGVSLGAYVVLGERVSLGDGVVVHPLASVYADAQVGAHTVIHSHAVVGAGARLGAHVILHPGAVIGADGFGFELTPEGTWLHVPQVGSVALEDGVEIGANACIDRAALDTTRVGEGTKIDNLVQIGHNCEIGAHCMICGQAGLAGSSHLGHHVVLGGQSGLSGHLHVGDGAQLAGSSGAMADIPAGQRYAGSPARPIREMGVQLLAMEKLPALLKQVKRLQRQVDALSASDNDDTA